jgi:hypothetical protein
MERLFGVRGSRGIRDDRHLVQNLLRDGEAFDSERFEVNFSVLYALAQCIATSTLDDVHAHGSTTNSNKENSKDDDQEHPQAWERSTGSCADSSPQSHVRSAVEYPAEILAVGHRRKVARV